MRPLSHSQHTQLQNAFLASSQTTLSISMYVLVKYTLSSEKTVQVRAPWPPCCAVSTNPIADTCCAMANQFRCHRRALVCSTESQWCISTSVLSNASLSQKMLSSAVAIFLSLSIANPSTKKLLPLQSHMAYPSIHKQSLATFLSANVNASKL